MPTPFYHLSVAKELVSRSALSPVASDLLQENYAAFLLGNTAPDVQTISGQARSTTHFFDFPIQSSHPAPWLVFFEQNDNLVAVHRLLPAQVAFLSGYLCHLLADWMWIRQIFLPVFGKKSEWSTFTKRLYLHNVLRSYQEAEILPSLRNGISANLQQAEPFGWLPFVSDSYLYTWRDFLTSQLQPGAAIKTIEVFATRQGIPPETYYQLLRSEERMEREVFAHLSRQTLTDYRQQIIAESLTLTQDYLAGRLI